MTELSRFIQGYVSPDGVINWLIALFAVLVVVHVWKRISQAARGKTWFNSHGG